NTPSNDIYTLSLHDALPICTYLIFKIKLYIWSVTKTKALTIKEIAKLADVSLGTVDRVIHKRGKVSKETEKKILDIIEKVNYKRSEEHTSELQSRENLVCRL